MSSTQYLTDAATRHAVFLQRYAGGRSREAVATLNRLRREINARLAIEHTDFQRQRLVAALDDIDLLAINAFGEISDKVLYDARHLAGTEASFSVELFNKASTVDWTLPSDTMLTAGVMTSQMSVNKGAGITIENALRNFSASKRTQITRVITDGVTLGDTTPVISRKVGELINTLQRRQLDALVRTVANNVSSVARNLVYEANSDIIDGYIWIATLDSRTTFICGSRDQKVFHPPNDPRPPAHWNACLEDTMITTRRGNVPIQDVKVGDYALTHAGRWKRVNAVMAKHKKCKAVELVDSFKARVRLTTDHPVLTSVGYKAAGDIKAGDKVFNYGNKLLRSKHGLLGSLVKQTVLTDAHDMKTEVVESLVAYSVTSKTAGMSSAVKLDNNSTGIGLNKKVSDVIPDYSLVSKSYIAILIKKITKHFFMKCRIVYKGGLK